ncbi:MAG: ribonuclease Z [Candidatus Aenigmatarchaeota archaeon]
MKPLEVVILGSGAIVPTKERHHSAIWIRREGDVFLWDCGEGTQRQIQKAGLSFMKIDKIFITHWHADHFAGLLGLIETFNLEGRERKLEIYGPEASRFVSLLLDLSWYDFGFDVEAMDVEFEDKGETTVVEGDGYTIKSTPAEHSIPAVAYSLEEEGKMNINEDKAANYDLHPGPKMGELKEKGEIKYKGNTIKLEDVSEFTSGRKVIYTGDTCPTENIKKFSEDADLLIHDATFAEEASHKHSSAAEAAKLATEANVKKLLLTHYSRRYKDPGELLKKAREYHENVEAAEELMRIKVE